MSGGISPLSLAGNVAEHWRTWRGRFENYLIASEFLKEDKSVQCAQLLHYMGEDGFKIYSTFKLETDDRNKLKPLMQKFQEHFEGKENTNYERYKLFSTKQGEAQSTEQFITDLQKQAAKCKLDTLQDSLVVTMIACGIKNNNVRERLLQEDNLPLDKAIELCRIIETSKVRSEVMSGVTNGATLQNEEVLSVYKALFSS
ncbi:uncharacterized protein [Leptinotarsa decemlineata]|uniref:uncharacterized protein n=1 Tax=Leptinotarsa decemlineata TaxID=7539 RepID=UPI003D305073